MRFESLAASSLIYWAVLNILELLDVFCSPNSFVDLPSRLLALSVEFDNPKPVEVSFMV